jgi:hypothetical protein
MPGLKLTWLPGVYLTWLSGVYLTWLPGVYPPECWLLGIHQYSDLNKCLTTYQRVHLYVPTMSVPWCCVSSLVPYLNSGCPACVLIWMSWCVSVCPGPAFLKPVTHKGRGTTGCLLIKYIGTHTHVPYKCVQSDSFNYMQQREPGFKTNICWGGRGIAYVRACSFLRDSFMRFSNSFFSSKVPGDWCFMALGNNGVTMI